MRATMQNDCAQRIWSLPLLLHCCTSSSVVWQNSSLMAADNCGGGLCWKCSSSPFQNENKIYWGKFGSSSKAGAAMFAHRWRSTTQKSLLSMKGVSKADSVAMMRRMSLAEKTTAETSSNVRIRLESLVRTLMSTKCLRLRLHCSHCSNTAHALAAAELCASTREKSASTSSGQMTLAAMVLFSDIALTQLSTRSAQRQDWHDCIKDTRASWPRLVTKRA